VTRELTTAGGLTAQDVWEYATRELTGAGTLPADTWAYATRTLTASVAQTIATLTGDNITVTRGDTVSLSLTGLGALTGYVSLDFSVKLSPSYTDAEATLRVRKNASGLNDGLLTLNGAAGTPAQGTITVDSEAAGNITLTVAAAAAAQLAAGKYQYDIQMITATAVHTLTIGEFAVVGDITKAVS
jgi:hypothetical protein